MNKEIKNSLKFLQDKKVILYPTDTVWGIGCDAIDKKAVLKVYGLKKREESKSLILLVSSIHMLKKYVSVSKKVVSILKQSDRPTTVIYPKPKNLPKSIIAKDNTIAIRVVNDPFCRKLIKQLKKPIVSTSANVSGEPTPQSFSEISPTILNGVDYVVNLHQNTKAPKPSKIIRVTEDDVEVIRE